MQHAREGHGFSQADLLDTQQVVGKFFGFYCTWPQSMHNEVLRTVASWVGQGNNSHLPLRVALSFSSPTYWRLASFRRSVSA
jgi:hypothetical protein